jgi:hypothetical protein
MRLCVGDKMLILKEKVGLLHDPIPYEIKNKPTTSQGR